MFSEFFIRRPIFAAVVSIVIVIAGGVSLFALPIAQYPNLAPPTVSVETTYPGANATVLSDTVASLIEEQVNGVEGMIYMSSTCSNDGSSRPARSARYATSMRCACSGKRSRAAVMALEEWSMPHNSIPSRTSGANISSSRPSLTPSARTRSPAAGRMRAAA